MNTNREIIMFPASGSRGSRSLLKYLRDQDIPFTKVVLASLEGARLTEQQGIHASPGILVDGVSVSPFDLLIPPACKVNEAVAQRVFGPASRQQTRMDTDDKKSHS